MTAYRKKIFTIVDGADDRVEFETDTEEDAAGVLKVSVNEEGATVHLNIDDLEDLRLFLQEVAGE